MNIVRIAALTGLVATFAAAQQQRVSPHERASATLAGKQITISYGRPYLKGRHAVGGSLVPYGKVWRTGADEATKLTTPVALTIGDVKVPAGSYSLFTLPEASTWTLIINKTADQFGAFDYDQSTDLGRTAMNLSKPSATVEQFTIKLEPKGAGAATLVMEWENTVASVPVKVAQ